VSAPNDRKTTRRRFLVFGAGAAAVGTGAVFLWPGLRERVSTWGLRLARASQTPERKLIEHFDYLHIPDDVARSYVADYRANVRDVGRLSELGSDFFTRFLMSTDFFQNGADESRTLSYVACYGPTISPCYNPLARLD
jgi:hypothetical protein